MLIIDYLFVTVFILCWIFLAVIVSSSFLCSLWSCFGVFFCITIWVDRLWSYGFFIVWGKVVLCAINVSWLIFVFKNRRRKFPIEINMSLNHFYYLSPWKNIKSVPGYKLINIFYVILCHLFSPKKHGHCTYSWWLLGPWALLSNLRHACRVY